MNPTAGVYNEHASRSGELLQHYSHRLHEHASGSGELLQHSRHRLYEHAPGLGEATGSSPWHKPLARPANTRCYSHKVVHKSLMMIVEHHGQPGRSHEHSPRTRTQWILTP
eukprot:1827026-Rhodomonas_salina.1